MLCSQCTEDLPAGSQFCLKCGQAAAATESYIVPEVTEVSLGCSRCGASLPADAQFCLKCGKPVSSATKNPGRFETPPPKTQEPRHSRRMVLWFLLALFLVGVVWLVVSDNPLAQQVQEMLGWKHDQTILDNTFSVGPHTFRYYKFALAEGSVNVAVAGQFTATADTSAHSSKDKGSAKGPENNIEVYVLTEPAFTIWQNGYATSSLYESGRVSEGTVQADIPAGAGIYYLVFNNKFSPKTAKAVRATVFLRYKSWLPEWFRRMKERFWNLLS